MSRCNVESTGTPLQTKSFNIVHQQIPIYDWRHKKDPPKHLNFCMLMRWWMSETKKSPNYRINWPPGSYFVKTRCPKISIKKIWNRRFTVFFTFFAAICIILVERKFWQKFKLISRKPTLQRYKIIHMKLYKVWMESLTRC